VRQSAVKQALVDAVELLLGYEEGVVLRLDVKVRVRELDEDSRLELGGDEWLPCDGSPRSSMPARKAADSRLSLAKTIMWLNETVKI
jgi:hypothetical protein